MPPGLLGRRVRTVQNGAVVEGEVVALTASEQGTSLYLWIVDERDAVLRRIFEGGGERVVVLPRGAETPLRDPT